MTGGGMIIFFTGLHELDFINIAWSIFGFIYSKFDIYGSHI